jgi:molybdopterin converting factor small subunit
MRVQVRLTEPFWRSVGKRVLEIEVEENALVGDLMRLLTKTYPELGREFAEAAPMVFVGEEEAAAESLLEEGQLVHLVWPIAGG